MNVQLLVIDMQNDFVTPKGSLFVPGADEDVKRVATFIDNAIKKIEDIHVTLDSHRNVQVFHPIFWVDKEGNHPNPFTIISENDVVSGTWKVTNPRWEQKGIDYVKALAAKGKFPLYVWPYHTIIGSIGHALAPCVSDALSRWEQTRFAMVNYCVKGDFFLTEHYGSLEAEVVYPEEPSTMLNTRLIETLKNADELIVVGEALSHCVRSTVEQIADNIGKDNIKKIVLLEDCCSSVPGFENLGKDFVQNMSARGMRVTTSIDYLA